jgi:hypothetical protein
MDSEIDIYKNKILLLNQQIKIRETIPENDRTNRQSIKLDNLKHELKINNDILQSLINTIKA